MRTFLLMATLLFLLGQSSWGQGVTGKYVGSTEDGPVTIIIRQGSGGRVSGTTSGDGYAIPFTGRIQGDRLTVTATVEGQPAVYFGAIRGKKITITGMGQRFTVTRAGSANAGPGRSKNGSAGGKVRVNGEALDSATVRRLEARYRVRIWPGSYWYDKRCGIWGHAGGPTKGVAAPGVNIGGPLGRNASNGDTGVIVNGRELHRREVAALQQLGPVLPGRFWLKANGDYGREGGGKLGSLAAASRTGAVRREGILSTWDRTGVAVYDLR